MFVLLQHHIYASLNGHYVHRKSKKKKGERDELFEGRKYIEGLVNNPISSD
jgi:hypothetical protein